VGPGSGRGLQEGKEEEEGIDLPEPRRGPRWIKLRASPEEKRQMAVQHDKKRGP